MFVFEEKDLSKTFTFIIKGQHLALVNMVCSDVSTFLKRAWILYLTNLDFFLGDISVLRIDSVPPETYEQRSRSWFSDKYEGSYVENWHRIMIPNAGNDQFNLCKESSPF